MTALQKIKNGNKEIIVNLTDSELQNALGYAHQIVNSVCHDTNRLVGILAFELLADETERRKRQNKPGNFNQRRQGGGMVIQSARPLSPSETSP